MKISEVTPMNLSTKLPDAVRAVVGLSPPVLKNAAVSQPGFIDAMVQALKETSNLQKESGRLTKEFTLESPTVSLEQTMLAGVKSNIAFQSTLQVRNRVVQAYTDIMNMQI
jgi:flagellar hook-basal body complex protein FliE